MAIKKTTEGKKRGKPDTSGVPGELVSIEGLNLLFGKNLRVSPYDALLDELAAPEASGKVLRFAGIQAKTSVTARAKKKGYRVSFAEDAGILYVRFDGRADDDIRQARREKILAALKRAPNTAMRLSAMLREGGDLTVDGQGVLVILAQMHRDNLVIKREGDEWGLNPRAKAPTPVSAA